MFENIRKSLIKALDPKGRLSQGFIVVSPGSAEKGIEKEGIDREDLYNIYKQHSIVRAVVDTIVRSVTAAGWEVVKSQRSEDPSDEEREKLLDFFDDPNPQDDLNIIISEVVTDLMIFGDAFVEVVADSEDDDAEPIGLYNLDATTITVKADERGKIIGYVQKVAGKDVVDFNPEEVMHIRLYSRGSSIYGLSKLESLVKTVDTDLKAQIYTGAYFNNFGAPKGLYVMEDGTNEDADMARSFLQEVASNPDAAHRSLLVKGKIKYQELATSFRESQLLDLRAFHRTEILSVYGVPPAKAQIIEGGMNQNAGEDQNRTFQHETIPSIQRLVEAKINKHIVRGMFGIDDWVFRFKSLLIEDRKTLASVHETYHGIGALTIPEIRDEMGYDPEIEIEVVAEGEDIEGEPIEGEPTGEIEVETPEDTIEEE